MGFSGNNNGELWRGLVVRAGIWKYGRLRTQPGQSLLMPHHIAIVEDEVSIAANYRDTLQRRAFRSPCSGTARLPARPCPATARPRHHRCRTGDDIEGGFELCRDLRSRCPELPIVFLTARDSELDIICGLRLGADDYLTKDISQAHMLARIVALFRRVQALRSPVLEGMSSSAAPQPEP